MDTEVQHLLTAARERGEEAVTGIVIPSGLDHFTTYVGLISSALELGKLIKTETRDLRVIESHHEIEMTRIQAAFSEIEKSMTIDFQSDESLREKNFAMIEKLIDAGQFELASEFHKRVMDNLRPNTLETIVDRRNQASSGTSRLIRR